MTIYGPITAFVPSEVHYEFINLDRTVESKDSDITLCSTMSCLAGSTLSSTVPRPRTPPFEEL